MDLLGSLNNRESEGFLVATGHLLDDLLAKTNHFRNPKLFIIPVHYPDNVFVRQSSIKRVYVKNGLNKDLHTHDL